MLNDPTIVLHGQSISSTGGISSNFRRTKIGAYTSVDGAFSTDQMARLTIKPQFRQVGPSTYDLRFEVDKNVAPVNGVQQSDDTLAISLRMVGNLRSFAPADFQSAVGSLSMTALVNMARILSGES